MFHRTRSHQNCFGTRSTLRWTAIPRVPQSEISKIRVSSFDRTPDEIDLVAALVDASLGIVEHAIFGKYLVYLPPPAAR